MNWYHGSPLKLETLRQGSTVTQWRELAEAFSHKPQLLCIDDGGNILHSGTQPGYLYVIDEEIQIGVDVFQHPRSSMEKGLEFLTARPLRLRYLCEVKAPAEEEASASRQLLERMLRERGKA